MITVTWLNILSVVTLLIPSVIIGYGSKAGSRTGLFILYVWIATSVIFGLMGLAAMLFALGMFAVIAIVFRRRLDIKKWRENSLKRQR